MPAEEAKLGLLDVMLKCKAFEPVKHPKKSRELLEYMFISKPF
jgi:hypothetical protein